MSGKLKHKSLSMFQQLLKIIIIPLITVGILLMILLPFLAGFLVYLSSSESFINTVKLATITFSDLQTKISELSFDPVIHEYLINGTNEIQVYEKLYFASNSSQPRFYFYLTDIKKTKTAIYQPSYSLEVDSIFSSVNSRLLQQSPNTILQLTNIGINKNFTSPLVFAQGIFEGDECLGYLAINYYPQHLESIFGNVDQMAFLTNTHGKIIYSYNSSLVLETGFNAHKKWGPFILVNGNLFFYQSSPLEITNITLISLTSLSFIPQIIYAILIALLLAAVTAVFVFTTFRRRFSKDTFTMLDDMFISLEEYRNKGILIPVQIRDNSMADYIQQYNNILQEIQSLIESNRQLMHETTVAQIKQLQSQFNPHFIFNTLASIQVMVHNDPIVANDMIQKLATMLRYSIRFGEESKVLLSDDIEYIKDYLSLQKMRFQELLEYKIMIEDSNFLVPKLILQPIIENSIQHGFKGDSLFRVEIAVYHILDDLVMIVRDNGCGMKMKELKKIQKSLRELPENSSHIGLVNCHRRLQLFYGPQYGITIDSKEAKGTVITLTCKAER